jgi:hypothetical protein
LKIATRIGVLALIASLVAAVALSASADEGTPDPDPSDPTAQTTDTLDGPSVVVIETERVSAAKAAADAAMGARSRTSAASGKGKIRHHVVAKNEGGSGGSPSATGCRKVRLDNKKFDYLGIDHLYTYTTWTEWCWNRSAKSVSSVSTGYSVYIDNSGIGWEGQVNLDKHFYASSTTSNSGYFHYRQGGFVNDFGPWTWGHSYPENTIRSHSDGTWTWATTD